MLIKYNKANMLRIGGSIDQFHFVLTPGVNDIPKKSWEWGLVRFPMLTTYIAEGVIEVEEDDKGEAIATSSDLLEVAEGESMADVVKAAYRSGDTAGDDLAGLNDKKARKLVRETFNDKLLTRWHEVEKRAAVVKEIEAQLAALAAAEAK